MQARTCWRTSVVRRAGFRPWLLAATLVVVVGPPVAGANPPEKPVAEKPRTEKVKVRPAIKYQPVSLAELVGWEKDDHRQAYAAHGGQQ